MTNHTNDIPEDVARLTVRWEEGGVVVVDELEKRVLALGGGWATVAFLYCDVDKASGSRGPRKIALRRYRKRGGRWTVHQKFVLTSEQQAAALQDALVAWAPGAD